MTTDNMARGRLEVQQTREWPIVYGPDNRHMLSMRTNKTLGCYWYGLQLCVYWYKVLQDCWCLWQTSLNCMKTRKSKADLLFWHESRRLACGDFIIIYLGSLDKWRLRVDWSMVDISLRRYHDNLCAERNMQWNIHTYTRIWRQQIRSSTLPFCIYLL